jgi:hypothetical protein
MLRRAHIFADENDIEVCAVTDLLSAKFSHRDDGEVALASSQSIYKNQTGFRQGGVFRE